MRLFYTGNLQADQPQTNPILSLGGYPSTSPVPANGIDKIFSQISQKHLSQGDRQIRGVVLKNETQNAISNAAIYYELKSQNPISSYRIGIVTLSQDSAGDYAMEKITEQGYPDAVLINAKGEFNKLSLPDIPAGGYVGLWLERKIDTIKSEQLTDSQSLLDQFYDETEPSASQVKYSFSAPLIAGDYFTIDTVKSQYVVWFNDGNQSAPQLGNTYEVLPITLSGGESVADIINSIKQKLESVVVPKQEITIEDDTSSITIINTTIGIVSEPKLSSLNITTAITQGSQSVDQLEKVELLISY